MQINYWQHYLLKWILKMEMKGLCNSNQNPIPAKHLPA